jgi:hypothetical protein
MRYKQEKWALRTTSAARSGLTADAVEVFLLPYYAGRTAPMQPDRKDLLRDYLHRQLEAVAELPALDGARPSETDGTMPLERASLEALCGACRGHCCRKGGEHAYLSPRTLQRILADDPAVSGKTLIDVYLSHVPARSYARSCIYHTLSGCALPRALRSETCREYFCPGMTAARASIAENPERPVIAVFERGYNAPRVLMVQAGEARKLRPQR